MSNLSRLSLKKEMELKKYMMFGGDISDSDGSEAFGDSFSEIIKGANAYRNYIEGSGQKGGAKNKTDLEEDFHDMYVSALDQAGGANNEDDEDEDMYETDVFEQEGGAKEKRKVKSSATSNLALKIMNKIISMIAVKYPEIRNRTTAAPIASAIYKDAKNELGSTIINQEVYDAAIKLAAEKMDYYVNKYRTENPGTKLSDTKPATKGQRESKPTESSGPTKGNNSTRKSEKAFANRYGNMKGGANLSTYNSTFLEKMWY
jgi:hypothetical protein